MKIMIPDMKFDNISLNAKPKAKPVRPKPATIADTFTPRVPRLLIKPIINKIGAI